MANIPDFIDIDLKDGYAVRFFYSKATDGCFTSNPTQHPEGMTKEEIRETITKNRFNFMKKIGLPTNIVYVTGQDRNNMGTFPDGNPRRIYPDGHSIILTPNTSAKLEEFQTHKGEQIDHYVSKADLDKASDYWSHSFPGENTVTTSPMTNIAKCMPIADGRIVTFIDVQNMTDSYTFCDMQYTNKNYAKNALEALQKHSGADLKNIVAFITPGLDWIDYEWDKFPTYATNKDVWTGFIHENPNKPGHYNIDELGAIMCQLMQCGLDPDQIIVDPIAKCSNQSTPRNTFEDPELLSWQAAKKIIELNKIAKEQNEPEIPNNKLGFSLAGHCLIKK